MKVRYGYGAGSSHNMNTYSMVVSKSWHYFEKATALYKFIKPINIFRVDVAIINNHPQPTYSISNQLWRLALYINMNVILRLDYWDSTGKWCHINTTPYPPHLWTWTLVRTQIPWVQLFGCQPTNHSSSQIPPSWTLVYARPRPQPYMIMNHNTTSIRVMADCPTPKGNICTQPS